MTDDYVEEAASLRHEETHDSAAAQSRLVVQPRDLIPLKTILEVEAGQATIDVYVVRVPVRAASVVLSSIKDIEPSTSRIDLQHLRRFATIDHLPSHLKATFSTSCSQSSGSEDGSVTPELYLVVAPAASITVGGLKARLLGIPGFSGPAHFLWTIPVPLLAPTSQDQASSWSMNFWPTVYKKNNPFGPHPSIVSRAEIEVAQDVHKWMNLATRLGSSAKELGIGEAVGVVLVERQANHARAVAVAADARWDDHLSRGAGKNIMAHAVLRAIGMYSRKMNVSRDDTALGMFADEPLLPQEQAIYDASEVRSDGYLCHNLEVYLTHEPCVMCSMALVHSRVGRVIFGHRMPKSGGLCSMRTLCSHGSQSSRVGRGHGLFWRKDLNWSILAWEMRTATGNVYIDPSVQV